MVILYARCQSHDADILKETHTDAMEKKIKLSDAEIEKSERKNILRRSKCIMLGFVVVSAQ